MLATGSHCNPVGRRSHGENLVLFGFFKGDMYHQVRRAQIVFSLLLFQNKAVTLVTFDPQMPEMLHNNAGEQGVGHCGFFLLQNAGILLGFAIMLLIAVFEHKIQRDLGY
ncbi:unnamed protein product [Boreogadus saida]